MHFLIFEMYQKCFISVPLQSDVDKAWNIDKSNEEPKYFEPEKTSIKKRSYHKREEDFLRMNHLTRFGDSEEGYHHAILGRRKRNNASVINFLTKLKYLNSYLKSKEANHNKINYLQEI